jgi:hypothetical protein
MPATRPEKLPAIEVGAWVRTSGMIQGGNDQSKLNDWHMDTNYVELHTGGRITKTVGVTLNLDAAVTSLNAPVAVSPSGSNTYVGIEDAILQFDFLNEFHLWAGHLLVPVDRANSAGPWFAVMWNFVGSVAFNGIPFAALPHTGPPFMVGRNNGAVVWGDIVGGRLTYAAGVFDNGEVTVFSPLYSGHLRLALLDPEPGFWGNGSYFGEKDIISIDVGGQYQKNGAAIPGLYQYKNLVEFNAGALIEKRFGGSWLTAEGTYYHYTALDGGPKQMFYVLGAFATPKVGVGNIQPQVRYQWAQVQQPAGTSMPNPWNVDAGIAYLIKGPALRVVATYGHTKNPYLMNTSNQTANSIQLGAQGIFF